jgi:UDP-glucose 4-epimerase
MQNSSKRCLVTGGAGFIGSHLVDRLLDEGHRVVALDNFSSGHDNNLASAKNHPQCTVRNIDIADCDELGNFFTDIDWVFHLAALADIVPSIERPYDYHRANVDGTIAVLEAARKAQVKRFIYAASSSCYGIASQYPTPETESIKPEYPYALTKYLAECYVMHWNQVYKLPAVSLRLINVYGPRARTTGAYGAVFGVFLAQKLAGSPLTVVGDGNQTRDFTFVSDVVDAFVKVAESNISGEIFNVGSGGTYSINQLVSLLGGETAYIPKRPGEPDCTYADITKIRRVLDWRPQVPFEEGVAVMLEHIEDWRDAPVWDEAAIASATEEWFNYLSKPAMVS